MKTSIMLKVLAAVGCASIPAGDLAIGAAGVGLAGASVSFAVVMIVQTGQWPSINGAEHLALFAQPVKVPYAGGTQDGGGRRDLGAGLDYTPIGTVHLKKMTSPEDRAGARPDPASPVLRGFRMRGMFQNEALVQAPSGFIMVKMGTEIEGAGSVTSIEARGRRWVIVTTKGLIESDD
jgi:hypothetical protein